MPETALVALSDRVGINTMVELINKTDSGFDLDAYRKDYYYDQMMLEKLKIGEENYVFLKYAKRFTLPVGVDKWTIRRSFPLTEHTVPLLEGIPPHSDKTKKERIEGTYHQYARYMEFADRVEWKLLDPIMMEYASEYGDVAARTLHRLARKELMSTTFKNYGGSRLSVGELQIGDVVTISQLRLAILKMARLLVNPISGSFPFITSEEHYWDLMKDSLIVEYIGANNGLEHYKSGKLPELFNLRFEKTMMDEFTFGYELGNAGEWTDGVNTFCRVYATVSDTYVYFNVPTNISTTYYRKTYVASEYRDLSGFLTASSRSVEEGLPEYKAATGGVEDADETNNRLTNGSYIPVRVRWTLALAGLYGTDETVAHTIDVTAETAWGTAGLYYKYDHTGNTAGEKLFTLYGSYLNTSNVRTYVEIGKVNTSDGLLTAAAINAQIALVTTGIAEVTGPGTNVTSETAIGASTLLYYTYVHAGTTWTVWKKYGSKYAQLGTSVAANLTVAAVTALVTALSAPTLKQLPVHIGFLLGEEALGQLEVSGQGGVKMFAKPKGSAGVLDPVDQRQSIGFKINTVGFKLIKNEACWLFYHVPTQAVATADISL